jgi:hypothetical protein
MSTKDDVFDKKFTFQKRFMAKEKCWNKHHRISNL